MPAIPRKPQHGEKPEVLVPIIGDLIDCIRAVWPRSSSEIGVATAANGTTFFLKSKPPKVQSIGSSGSWRYSSYFKVVDSSSDGTPRLSVVDGSPISPDEDYCGSVWINGEIAYAENWGPTEIEAAGTVYFWLVSYITEGGVYAEIQTTSSNSPPVKASLAYATQLLGRASVVSDGEGGYLVSAINQDYLRGGEHMVVMFSDCSLIGV